ncbi:ribonuclease J [Paludicola sp. MB14-C6]|uniref:ribonuclease J n=1 Tax=Paludihabitans sp. MB14-C6 TaxID=3070656 RepID=UPI0027DDB34E|nr:ribonuclease J [Paludicola sp. MB14-C6]WMJ24132.1 ribonuclease J [Paludicola sp. MB14-C6]
MNKPKQSAQAEPKQAPPVASFLKNPNTNQKPVTPKATKTATKAAHNANTPKATVNPKPQTAKKAQPKTIKATKTNTKSTNPTRTTNTQRRTKKPSNKNQQAQVPIRVIPLGGLNEIGKNMTMYECQGDMFIVDCGLAFPDADMLGVDLVIPDFTYVEKNIDKIKGMVITHGHEDHIGSIPYLLKKFDIPIYASPLAIGLIKGKLKEHGLLNKAKLHVVAPRQKVKMGCMTIEFIRVNHSIPDAMAIAIHSPAGIIIQTGDFKVDYSPIEGEVIDIARFAELGSEGVLCLLSDSTNAERPGSTVSERKIGQSFQGLFSNAEGKRIIIASFASNIHRIQQIIDCAEKFGRKVAVSGRSMENVVAVAIELGYLTVPKGLLIDIDAINNYRSDQLIIITTGSQGEPMSALSRMASGDHRKVAVTPNDFIIISATPIPGNEKHVTRVVNDLLKLGADVIYSAMYEVHVSGHACQDELKMMLAITKPKFFIPVHGEFKHLKAHSKLATDMGVDKNNIHIGEIGQVIELTQDSMKLVSTVEAGRVLVDGLGVGDVGAIVLRDRRHLAQDGLIIVVMTMESASGALLAGPDIVSRGFVYVREAEELISEAKVVVKNILDKCFDEGIRDWATIKINVRDGLSNFIYKKTKRGPMILPIITEV